MAEANNSKSHVVLKDRVELLVLGYIRLFIEKEVENIPIECKFICKDFFGGLIDSKILKMDEESLLLTFIKQQTQSDWNWKLIYRGSENGYKRDDFYKHCQNKGNTVVIVHNSTNHVFGGYTPCEWIKNDHSVEYGTDKTLSTFLFSLRSTSKNVARIFKLKYSAMDKAVSYHDNTAFDFGHNDFYLYREEVATEKNGCCFEWYDTNQRGFLNGKTAYSKPKEIEIHQLY